MSEERALAELQMTYSVQARSSPVLDLLEGRVFHATTIRAWQQIKVEREIRPDASACFSAYGGCNSYFRNRGCVCVFDWRRQDEEAKRFRGVLHPLNHARHPQVVLLVMREEIHGRLIPSEAVRQERAWSELVVPIVEAGHEGAIALSLIDLAVVVSLQTDVDARRYPWLP